MTPLKSNRAQQSSFLFPAQKIYSADHSVCGMILRSGVRYRASGSAILTILRD
jgi:hypothetical protein